MASMNAGRPSHRGDYARRNAEMRRGWRPRIWLARDETDQCGHDWTFKGQRVACLRSVDHDGEHAGLIDPEVLRAC